MRTDAVHFDIMKAVMENGRVKSPVRWYGFGSYFKGDEAFSDIDLLAVCSNAEDAGMLRSRMREVCEQWPVHLVIMTEYEAAETDFVASEGCIPLASSTAGVDSIGPDKRPSRLSTRLHRSIPSNPPISNQITTRPAVQFISPKSLHFL